MDSNSDRLTVRELIRLELQGKAVATGRYNNIQLRIRAGYVIALYGALLLFAGKESALSATLNQPALAGAVFITIFSISAVIAILDISYRIRELRVVAAFNRLMDIALGLATDKAVEIEELKALLHIVGESPLSEMTSARIGALRYLTTVVLIGSLYIAMPVLGLLLYGLVHRAAQ